MIARQDQFILGIIGLICLVTPLFLTNPYYLNVLNIVALHTIIVIGLTLFIGYAGQISLGHGAFYGLGAYGAGILSLYGLNPWLSVALGGVAAGLAAFVLGLKALRLRGHYLVMATLGFNLIVTLLIIELEDLTGGLTGLPGIPPLYLGGLSLADDRSFYFLAWTVALLSIYLALNLISSRIGRALRAIKAGELAAATVGIDVPRYKLVIFVYSAVLAGLAGGLYAHYLSFISPKTFDIFFSVEIVTMVLIGGVGNIWGALAGAGLLTPLPQVLHFFEDYKDLAYGLILMFILILRPEGLVSIIRKDS
ncbi:branched-chain amino acid ABC transporter permease [Thermosulfuriphilus sp.]